MRTLNRTEKIQNALRYTNLALQVFEAISRGRVERAVASRVKTVLHGDTEPWMKKSPAKIWVTSERIEETK